MALTKTQVSELYVVLINRASEGEGNSFWQSASATNTDETIANEMLASQPAQDFFGTSLDTDQAFVEHIYSNALNKTVAEDPDGIAFWVNALAAGNSRGLIVTELVKAARDPANAGAAQDQFVNRVTVSDYTADNLATAPTDLNSLVFGTGGLTVTSDAATVTTAQSAVDVLVSGSGTTFTLTSDVSSALEGTAVTFTITASAAVTADTEVTFTVVPDNTSAADAGTSSSNLADFAAGTFNPTTATIAAGQTTATFTVTAASDSVTELVENYSVEAAVTGGSTVTASASILDSVSGGSFVLTTAADNITGTANDDTILGATSAAVATDTYQSQDSIDGGSGTDTVSIVVGADVTSVIPSMSNVEVLQVRSTAAAAKVTASNSGLTKLVNSGSSAVLEFDAIGNITDLGIANTTSNTTFTYGTSMLGTSTGTIALALDAVGSSITSAVATINVTTDVVTTLNVDVASTSYVTTDDSAGDPWATATTLTVTGAGGLTLTGTTAGLDAAKTIDVSANTGGVSVDLKTGGNANAVTFTGGTGDDKISFAATQLTILDTVDGGTGTDTLAIADTSISATLLTAINGQVSNTEVIQGTGAGFTVDMATFTNGIVDVNIGGAGATSITNSLNATKVTFAKNVDNNASTFALAGKIGESIANVDLLGGVKTGTTTFTGLTTINVDSSGSSANLLGKEAGITTALGNADNVNIVVTGSQDLEIDQLAATTTGSKVDASALTGKLTTIGSTKADILIGGTGDDTIQIGTAAAAGLAGSSDTLTGGAGSDNFTLSETHDTNAATTLIALLKQSAGTTSVVKITDFVSGTDKIVLDHTAGSVSGTSMTLASAQTIASAADLTAVYAGISAISASTGGGALNGVQVNVTAGAAAGTYVYINDNTAGVSNTDDMLIDITGLSGTLASTDFTLS